MEPCGDRRQAGQKALTTISAFFFRAQAGSARSASGLFFSHVISLQNLTLRRGAKVLLDGASATIHPGEKVALVGRNGAGKSTLFALLGGALHEDGGDFSMPAHWRIAQVAQHMPETGEAATAFVLAGDERLTRLRAQLAQAEAAGEGMAIAQLHADLQDAGAHDATARAQALILGLGFKPGQLQQPVNSFSGGWRMRLQLARALMAPSDLLLLDEPTNHLDLATREALAVALNSFEGTLMLVSHDRALLRSVCDEFWLVARGHVQPFEGDLRDYQRYLLDEAKRQREAAAQEASAAAPKTGPLTANSINPAEQRRQQARLRAQLAEKTKPLKRQLAAADARMAAIATRRTELETQLATPQPPAAIADAGRELKALENELTALEEQWLELSTQIEEIENGQA